MSARTRRKQAAHPESPRGDDGAREETAEIRSESPVNGPASPSAQRKLVFAEQVCQGVGAPPNIDEIDMTKENDGASRPRAVSRSTRYKLALQNIALQACPLRVVHDVLRLL